MYIKWILLSGLAMTLACSAPASESGDSAKASTAVSKQSGETANEVVLPYPVYTSFEQLAPIFEYNNDTTYVINFWATWCGPCVKELPYFEQLHTHYTSEDAPVSVILVSLDFAKDVSTKLLDFVEKRDLQSHVIALLDGRYNNWIDKVEPEWSGAIPVTIIYKGRNRTFIPEEISDYSTLFAEVEKIYKS